jgi:hypothetical protein
MWATTLSMPLLPNFGQSARLGECSKRCAVDALEDINASGWLTGKDHV